MGGGCDGLNRSHQTVWVGDGGDDYRGGGETEGGGSALTSMGQEGGPKGGQHVLGRG